VEELSASGRLSGPEDDITRFGALVATDHWHLYQSAVKRLLDVVMALLLLAALLPVLGVVAMLVGLSSSGPILFKQRRLGRGGQEFWFYKFRTMVDGNDPADHRAYTHALIRGQAQPVRGAFKLADDPRVTPLGAFLRRYSIDEFPQLINVLLGHMSIVGPRPPLPYEAELYGPLEWQRLAVTPGLTGLWQVSGRSRLTFEEMIELDLEYIDRWSLWLDVLIIIRTPLAMLAGDGAR
jgi:lipopolysaccharide/colanic/teichoic acid biosynthesis glycosyltransferase